ncbi:MAG: hypothetical protein WA146_04940 [Thiobacillus sp.]
MSTKTKNRIVVIALVGLVHFIFTLITTNIIAKQIGNDVGNIVVKELTRNHETIVPSESTVSGAYAEINRVTTLSKGWEYSLLIVSLPAKSAMRPVADKVRKLWAYEPALSSVITMDQFMSRNNIISITVNALNSFSLGVVLYLGLMLIDVIRKNNG